MSKKILCIILAVFFISTAFALNLETHLGLLSGIGISKNYGKIKIGADIESSFPGYSIGYAIACDEDCSFGKGFLQGSQYFLGLDTYAHYTLYKGKIISILAGIDLFSGFEIPIQTFDMVAKASVVFSKEFSGNKALFLNINCPFLALTHVKGFNNPMIFIPQYKILSLLTGCRLGFSVEI